jgi:acylphosphatase
MIALFLRATGSAADAEVAVRYNHLMRVARRFKVSGRVQGVGFRYFALDAARREGVHGYVTNHDDGTVEAVAEGEAESVERFERALRRGPSRSRVEHVRVDESEPGGLQAGFEIR